MVDSLLKWGLSVIVYIQQVHNPALDYFFIGITLIGENQFYLLVLPFILWCMDFKAGVRLTILFLLSTYVNIDLKWLFRQPRPFDLDPSVKLFTAEGYGLPSFHAQIAIDIWPGAAIWLRKTWSWILAVVMVLLISFSRIYLGVHFPTDVFAAWIIGLVILGIYLLTALRIEKLLAHLNMLIQILIALAVPLILILIQPTLDAIAVMGTFSGFSIGLVFSPSDISSNTMGTRRQLALRYLLGISVMLVIYLGARVILPGPDSPLYPVFYFLQYWLIGLWMSFGAPQVFKWLKLTD